MPQHIEHSHGRRRRYDRLALLVQTLIAARLQRVAAHTARPRARTVVTVDALRVVLGVGGARGRGGESGRGGGRAGSVLLRKRRV